MSTLVNRRPLLCPVSQVFYANVPTSVGKAELQALFSNFGTVSEVVPFVGNGRPGSGKVSTCLYTHPCLFCWAQHVCDIAVMIPAVSSS